MALVAIIQVCFVEERGSGDLESLKIKFRVQYIRNEGKIPNTASSNRSASFHSGIVVCICTQR